MVLTRNRKLMLAAAASATALGVAAPAAAGGYYGHVGYSNHYYGNHYRHNGYYGHRGYRRGHHGGGGKAAAIALGVIGGAIILNEVAENRAEQRAYEARYADRYDRYDRYARRAQPAYDRDAFERGYEEGYSEGRAADIEGGAPRDLSNGPSRKGALDDRLDGGPEPIRFSAAEAYQTCMTHARAALGDRGFLLAAPPTPETAEDTGGAWKMTATVSAQNPAGESWSRAMYCEADETRVYLLELI